LTCGWYFSIFLSGLRVLLDLMQNAPTDQLEFHALIITSFKLRASLLRKRMEQRSNIFLNGVIEPLFDLCNTLQPLI
jgi:hypothetical protein